MPRKITQSLKRERNALPTVGLHPEIRTLSYAISHAPLAALPWVLVQQSRTASA